MYTLNAFAFTLAAIMSEAKVCRHSCRPIGLRPTWAHAAFARLRTFDGVNGCDALVPKTSPTCRPERSLCPRRCSRRTPAMGTDRRADRLFGVTRPSLASQER